ncbi:MAG TPA: cell division protein FtsL [Anaeromyxobacter sp.]
MSRARTTSAPVLSRLGRAAAVAVVLVSLGIFHVWARTRVLSAGYALGELQKEHVRLTSEHDRLRIEVETLRSPATLERFARTRLGMAPPAPGAVQAAGPQPALAGGGGKGVSGVTHPGPAEPSRSLVALRGPRVAGRAPPER